MKCTIEALYAVLALTDKIEKSNDAKLNMILEQIEEEQFQEQEIEELKLLVLTTNIAEHLGLPKMHEIQGYLIGYREFCENEVRKYEENFNRNMNT